MGILDWWQSKPTSYCHGYLRRNPKILPVSGVNLVCGWNETLSQLRIASKTFDTVRLWCSRFNGQFLKGKDSFTPIVSEMPEELKLIPILFDQRFIKPIKDKIKEWLNYWLQDKFQKKYLYLDVCNEPRPWKYPWLKKFLVDVLGKCRRLAPDLPLCVGFGGKAIYVDQDFVESVISLCDVVTFHHYESDPAKYVSLFRDLLEFYTSFHKPVVVTEFNVGAGEKEQACWLANILNEIKKADIEGYCVHDLKEPPQTGLQWGIYRQDWTPKKCFKLFP